MSALKGVKFIVCQHGPPGHRTNPWPSTKIQIGRKADQGPWRGREPGESGRNAAMESNIERDPRGPGGRGHGLHHRRNGRRHRHRLGPHRGRDRQASWARSPWAWSPSPSTSRANSRLGVKPKTASRPPPPARALADDRGLDHHYPQRPAAPARRQERRRFSDMLKKADEVLYYAVKGIADLITVHGLINLDFADVKAAMSSSGMALMGTGIASGEGRAKEAAMQGDHLPAAGGRVHRGRQGRAHQHHLFAPDMLIDEVSEAADIIYKRSPRRCRDFLRHGLRSRTRATKCASRSSPRASSRPPWRRPNAVLSPRPRSRSSASWDPAGIERIPVRGPRQEPRAPVPCIAQDRNIPAYLR